MKNHENDRFALTEEEERKMYAYLRNKYEVRVDDSGEVVIDYQKPKVQQVKQQTLEDLMKSKTASDTDLAGQLKVLTYQPPSPAPKVEVVKEEPAAPPAVQAAPLTKEEQERAFVEQQYYEQHGFSPFKLEEENNRYSREIAELAEKLASGVQELQGASARLSETKARNARLTKENDMLEESIQAVRVSMADLLKRAE